MKLRVVAAAEAAVLVAIAPLFAMYVGVTPLRQDYIAAVRERVRMAVRGV